jgi:pyridoxamine 5'-phosphate oxidase
MPTSSSGEASSSLRDRLSSVRMPDSPAPDFDPAQAPERPFELFAEWLDAAIDAAVPALHTMTLATSSPEGGPAARTVLLQDVTSDTGGLAFRFASSADSPKGHDLAADPRAALVLHWREQHRQIRVTGVVRPAEREFSEADFTGRSPGNRAGVLAARQSEVMPDDEDVERLLAGARELLAGNPGFVPPTWTVYLLDASSVEFWQGQPRQQQHRLRYQRTADNAADGWRRDRLWP